MRNVKELRDESAKVLQGLKDGNIDVQDAQVRVRALNTMISSAKTQVEHYQQIGRKDSISFLISD